MGGLWGFWLALDRPERVSALAQLGSTALLVGTEAPLPMRLLSVPGLNRLMLASERPRAVCGLTELRAKMGHERLLVGPQALKALAAIDRGLARGEVLETFGISLATLTSAG
jgi:pimeloyl-ACP methyl ester carboxylesterase